MISTGPISPFVVLLLCKKKCKKHYYFVCLFVCLGLSSHLKHFHSYGDVTINGEELQNLALDRHSWLLSTVGFFSVQYLLWQKAYVYNGHFRGPVTHTPFAERLAVELSLPVFFYKLGLSLMGFEHPTFRLRCQRSDPLRHCCGFTILLWKKYTCICMNSNIDIFTLLNNNTTILLLYIFFLEIVFC